MKLLGYELKKSAPEISSQAQIVNTNPQGPMTDAFQNYVLRKVSGTFYEQLREGIPIIDAAIRRLISLNGTIRIIGDNPEIVRALEEFCLNVPVNDTQKGIHAFFENFANETFEQGFAVAEYIATPGLDDIVGLRVADSKQIIYRRNREGKAEPWYSYPKQYQTQGYVMPADVIDKIMNASYGQTVVVNGVEEVKLNPANLLYHSINNENSDPYGVSIMRSMEFVAQILVTIQNSLKSVFERFGDPSYHLHYEASKVGSDAALAARKAEIEDGFTAVTNAKRTGRSGDFVTVGSKDSKVEISVIGADGQIIPADIPLRHVLEQIVSKTNLPAWMLGIYWSTTERMATLEVESALQDARIRQLAMLPEFIRLFSAYLRLKGYKWKTVTTSVDKPGDWGIVFETPNLRDMVAQAQARFLNAQADLMSRGVDPNNTQTSVQVGGASFEINGMKFQSPLIPLCKGGSEAGGFCGCGKDHNAPRPPLTLRGGVNKETRLIPWPELDKIEAEFEELLKGKWGDLKGKVFTVLKLTTPSSPPKIGGETLFTLAPEQRQQVIDAVKAWIAEWKPGMAGLGDPLRWHYGQAYSLGLIRAVEMLKKGKSHGGEKADTPILDLIKNREIFDALVAEGFSLVKDNATKAVMEEMFSEIEAMIIAGTNPVHVAAKLEKLFGDKNSDWERLARSEMAMAAEKAKLDEWKAWGMKKVYFSPAPDACPFCLSLEGEYEIGKCPLPVRDTHPRCRCSSRPV